VRARLETAKPERVVISLTNISSPSFPMPKAYAVVTYRSVSDAEKLAAYAKLAGPAVVLSGLVSLLEATLQSSVNGG
jgi:hypothetical protein